MKIRAAFLGIVLAAAGDGQTGRTASASGRVVDASTGQGIAGATVELGAMGGMVTASTQKTDDSGIFRASGLVSGDYWVSVRAEGYVGITGYHADGLVVQAQTQGAAPVTVRLTRESVLAGRVVTETGEPVGGVQVRAGFEEVHADREGRFSFRGLAAGEYKLSVETSEQVRQGQSKVEPGTGRRLVLPGTAYYPRTTDAAGAMPVKVSPQVPVQGLEFVLPWRRQVRVRGRLAQGPESRRLEGGRIRLERPGLRTTSLPALLDQGAEIRDGQFEMEVPGAGTYEARLFAAGASPFEPTFLSQVEVADAETAEVLIAMPRAGRLAGRIVAPEGAEVSNISMSKPGAWRGPRATVDGEGRFEFVDVPEGEWMVNGFGGDGSGIRVQMEAVRQGGVYLDRGKVFVRAGDNPEVEVRFARSYMLSGIVVDAAGQPVPSAYVNLTPLGGQAGHGNLARAGGQFSVSAGAATYAITAWRTMLNGPETRVCKTAARLEVNGDVTGLRIPVCD